MLTLSKTSSISYPTRKALLLFLLVFPFLPQNSAAQTAKKICLVETRTYPGEIGFMWQSLLAASDGKVYTGICNEGGAANFFLYEPAVDSNRILCDMGEFLKERGKGIRMASKLHNHPVEGKDGSIYLISMNDGAGPDNIDYTSYPGGHWIKYDPKKDKLEDMGFVDQNVGCYSLAIDRERNILYGLGYTCYLYKFDIDQRVTTNLGRVDNWDICRDIACDDLGNCYGNFPVSRLWKYDAEKGKVFDLSLTIPFDPTMYPTQLRNPMLDRSTIWRAVEWDPVDKAIYGVTCGSGSILFRYFPHEGAEGRVEELAKMCDSKFLGTDRKDIPYSPLGFALDSRNRKIYFAPSARGYDIGRYVETFGSSEEHHLIMYDLTANQRVDLGAMQTADGRHVFGSEAASCAADGTVYLCAQAEVKDPARATRRIGNIPVALQLIIYRPR